MFRERHEQSHVQQTPRCQPVLHLNRELVLCDVTKVSKPNIELTNGVYNKFLQLVPRTDRLANSGLYSYFLLRLLLVTDDFITFTGRY